MTRQIVIGMLLMGLVVGKAVAGAHETQAGNGGGDDVFDSQTFKIEGGTEIQRELWFKALNDAARLARNLYTFSKDKSYVVLFLCIYESPYTIVDSEYKDPNDELHRHARTFVNPDASIDVQWASPTEVYRTAFVDQVNDKDRRDLAIHEALHRQNPKLLEPAILDLQKTIISIYEKLDVKSVIQNWVPSVISQEQTVLPFYLHDLLILSEWKGTCTITEGDRLLMGATGDCRVKFTHWSAPYNRDIWGVTPLTLDIEGTLKNTVKEYNLGNLWLGSSVTRSYTVSARQVILGGEINFDVGNLLITGENEFMGLRNHKNQEFREPSFSGVMPVDISINPASYLDLNVKCTTKKMGGEDIVLFVRLRPEL